MVSTKKWTKEDSQGLEHIIEALNPTVEIGQRLLAELGWQNNEDLEEFKRKNPKLLKKLDLDYSSEVDCFDESDYKSYLNDMPNWKREIVKIRKQKKIDEERHKPIKLRRRNSFIIKKKNCVFPISRYDFPLLLNVVLPFVQDKYGVNIADDIKLIKKNNLSKFEESLGTLTEKILSFDTPSAEFLLNVVEEIVDKADTNLFEYSRFKLPLTNKDKLQILKKMYESTQLGASQQKPLKIDCKNLVMNTIAYAEERYPHWDGRLLKKSYKHPTPLSLATPILKSFLLRMMLYSALKKEQFQLCAIFRTVLNETHIQIERGTFRLDKLPMECTAFGEHCFSEHKNHKITGCCCNETSCNSDDKALKMFYPQNTSFLSRTFRTFRAILLFFALITIPVWITIICTIIYNYTIQTLNKQKTYEWNSEVEEFKKLKIDEQNLVPFVNTDSVKEDCKKSFLKKNNNGKNKALMNTAIVLTPLPLMKKPSDILNVDKTLLDSSTTSLDQTQNSEKKNIQMTIKGIQQQKPKSQILLPNGRIQKVSMNFEEDDWDE